ncbi:MAG: ribosome silencing factor [Candidatus Liberibacter europaeus]|uniref:Ribosomal silencing factor RsfS n=1 Tax=Candidatus Liberibacter europaeus TaxID=744859 RepID=A0A2T4VYK7_9HYPH|nr:ribosome silencing factor [Candidatus Liberibacter europaeus]PTL86855.1 MAG: ribosome silencing factor [Candidatus Liberibacter europaeus]
MEKIDHSSSYLHVIMESLQESKAEDICHIENTPARSLVCDNMVIVSGKSSKHVTSIADNLVAYLKKHNIEVLGIEGLLSANWVLIDVGDVMVHVFHPESRKLYDLESMWI